MRKELEMYRSLVSGNVALAAAQAQRARALVFGPLLRTRNPRMDRISPSFSFSPLVVCVHFGDRSAMVCAVARLCGEHVDKDDNSRHAAHRDSRWRCGCEIARTCRCQLGARVRGVRG